MTEVSTEQGCDLRVGHVTHLRLISHLSHMCISHVWPHFRRNRIGNKFQAETPEIQERPPAETGEHGASLVRKASHDAMSNTETQDRGG